MSWNELDIILSRRQQGQSQNAGSSNSDNAPSNTQTRPTSTSSATLSTNPSSSVKLSTIVTIAVVIGIALLLVFTFTILRQIRKKHSNPRYIPTSFLKKQWANWSPSHSKPSAYRDSSGLEALSATTQTRYQFSASLAAQANSQANIDANAAIDRHASVRSVMTLPAYNSKPGETEQVLGREGERGGIDTVLEFPEGEEDAENQRDEEMEALYQVRLARRNQIAEREERERLRAEARARGDTAAIRELRNARLVNTPSTVEAARAAHEAVKSRARTISSVSYADLGIARHDGTRVRANSEESERPLLGDAASMAESRRLSTTTTFTMNHERNASTHSLASIGTYASGDLPPPHIPASRSRASSGASLQRIVTSGTQSTPDLMDHDGYHSFQPPDYTNVDNVSPLGAPPPSYFSPVDATAPQLPAPSHQDTRSASNNAAQPRQHTDEAIPASSTGQVSPSADDIATSMLGPSATRMRNSERGVGGIPQLPSLRLSALPSINISEPTPVDNVRRLSDEFD